MAFITRDVEQDEMDHRDAPTQLRGRLPSGYHARLRPLPVKTRSKRRRLGRRSRGRRRTQAEIKVPVSELEVVAIPIAPNTRRFESADRDSEWTSESVGSPRQMGRLAVGDSKFGYWGSP